MASGKRHFSEPDHIECPIDHRTVNKMYDRGQRTPHSASCESHLEWPRLNVQAMFRVLPQDPKCAPPLYNTVDRPSPLRAYQLQFSISSIQANITTVYIVCILRDVILHEAHRKPAVHRRDDFIVHQIVTEIQQLLINREVCQQRCVSAFVVELEQDLVQNLEERRNAVSLWCSMTHAIVKALAATALVYTFDGQRFVPVGIFMRNDQRSVDLLLERPIPFSLSNHAEDVEWTIGAFADHLFQHRLHRVVHQSLLTQELSNRIEICTNATPVRTLAARCRWTCALLTSFATRDFVLPIQLVQHSFDVCKHMTVSQECLQRRSGALGIALTVTCGS